MLLNFQLSVLSLRGVVGKGGGGSTDLAEGAVQAGVDQDRGGQEEEGEDEEGVDDVVLHGVPPRSEGRLCLQQ